MMYVCVYCMNVVPEEDDTHDNADQRQAVM